MSFTQQIVCVFVCFVCVCVLGSGSTALEGDGDARADGGTPLLVAHARMQDDHHQQLS